MKRGVASCLLHRAKTVAIGENVRREEKHLNKVLKANGYPDHIIRSAARPGGEREPEEAPKYTICIPYVAGVSEDLRRVCRRYTISTLRKQLTRVKDPDQC